MFHSQMLTNHRLYSDVVRSVELGEARLISLNNNLERIGLQIIILHSQIMISSPQYKHPMMSYNFFNFKLKLYAYHNYFEITYTLKVENKAKNLDEFVCA